MTASSKPADFYNRWLCQALLLIISTTLFVRYSELSLIFHHQYSVNSLPQHLSALFLGNSLIEAWGVYVISFFTIGFLLDLIGHRFILALSALLTGIACIIVLNLQTSVQLLYCRWFLGITASGSLISTLSYAFAHLKKGNFIYLNSVIALLSVFAIEIGQMPFSSLISKQYWHFLVLASSCCALGLSVLFFKLFPKHSGNKYFWSDLKETLHTSQLWIAAFCMGLLFVPIISFALLWGEPFIRTLYQVSINSANYIATSSYIGVSIGAIVLASLVNQGHSLPKLLYRGALFSLLLLLIRLYIPAIPLSVMLCLSILSGCCLSSFTLAIPIILRASKARAYNSALGIAFTIKIGVGLIIIRLTATLLSEHWAGGLANHQAIYSIFNYHFSLALLPVCIAIAIMLALVLIASNSWSQTK